MIFIDLLVAFEALINSMVSLLPNPSVPGLNGMATTLVSDSWFGHFAWMNDYLPVSDVVEAGVVVVTAWGAMWLVKLLIWVLGKVHLLGGD